jgi:hypothetical protein
MSVIDFTLSRILVSDDLLSLWLLGRSAEGEKLDPLPLVPCQCGECHRERTFVCDDCGRSVWWCYGMDDDYPGLCDFCWNEKMSG